MVVLKSSVICISCKNQVNKLETIKFKSNNNETEPRYQCPSCFKKAKTIKWGFGDEIKEKAPHQCLRCKYKFQSKTGICPYCSKGDQVIKGKVTIHDLL